MHSAGSNSKVEPYAVYIIVFLPAVVFFLKVNKQFGKLDRNYYRHYYYHYIWRNVFIPQCDDHE